MTVSVRRVYVADPQPLVTEGLMSLIDGMDGCEAILGSIDPQILPASAADSAADLVVVGIGTRPERLLAAIGLLKSTRPGVRVFVLTDPHEPVAASDLIAAGVTGVASRFAPVAEVMDGIRHALAGRSLLAADMAGRLVSELANAVRVGGAKASGGLTRRELDVLQLVADGLPNREVADQLHISENTVKNHMRSVHDKLGVRTRTEAVVTAARKGLLGLR